MASKASTPNMPRLLMVKLPVVYSSGASCRVSQAGGGVETGGAFRAASGHSCVVGGKERGATAQTPRDRPTQPDPGGTGDAVSGRTVVQLPAAVAAPGQLRTPRVPVPLCSRAHLLAARALHQIGPVAAELVDVHLRTSGGASRRGGGRRIRGGVPGGGGSSCMVAVRAVHAPPLRPHLVGVLEHGRDEAAVGHGHSHGHVHAAVVGDAVAVGGGHCSGEVAARAVARRSGRQRLARLRRRRRRRRAR